MNQILSVEPPKPKKDKKPKSTMGNSSGGVIEIEKIVRFFAIVLIVFGMIMIGSGSYSMYQGSQTGNSQAKPTISVKEISETQLEIEISHNSPLQRVTYNWNNDEIVELEAEGKKSINQTIEIPTGENTLNIYAVDEEGKETNYSRQYTKQGDISIEFELDGSNLNVIASGKNELSYMTYRWDEEEEQKVDINNIEVEYSIEIPMGQHTLTVSIVDVNNTMETKKQEVKGVTRPTVEVTTDGSSNFIIKASDESGIQRIEFVLNDGTPGVVYCDKAIPDVEQRKQIEIPYPIQDGENRLEITVFNEDGVSTTKKVMVNK